MREYLEFFIDGQWVDPAELRILDVENPATERACGPESLDTGYYVRPTVFADVDNGMTIAREEIFGSVLCILGYDDLEQAVQIGNDTEYGLYRYVSGADLDEARALAGRIRAGTVSINHSLDIAAPFGGYKQSGNGREWGEFGFHEFLETKGIVGYGVGNGAGD